jgi:hypothetical protein
VIGTERFIIDFELRIIEFEYMCGSKDGVCVD